MAYPSYATETTDYFNRAGQYAMPSAQSRDTAAARVRSRVQAQTTANQAQIQDKYRGMGRLNTGGYRYAQGQNMAAGQHELATGLANLESDFADKEQEGAKILSGVGQGYAGYGLGLEGENTKRYDIDTTDATDRYDINTDAALRQKEMQNRLLEIFGLYGKGLGEYSGGSTAPQINELIEAIFGNRNTNPTPR